MKKLDPYVPQTGRISCLDYINVPKMINAIKKSIDYNRYLVCSGTYPFKELGHMNKVNGEDEAHHIEAARRRFGESNPVLIDVEASARFDQQARDRIHFGS